MKIDNLGTAADLPVFEPEKFKQQIINDIALGQELIDVFLSERARQIPEMREAIAAQDHQTLSRVAHTIKGSLGSLHAPRARIHAQELETAANKGDLATYPGLLAVLEEDLDNLERELVSWRQSAR